MGRGVTGVRRTAQKVMWLGRAFEAKAGGDEVGGPGAGLEQTGRAGPGKELRDGKSVEGALSEWKSAGLGPAACPWEG